MNENGFKPVIFDNLFPFYDPKEEKINNYVVLNGNLTVIEVNQEKIDPYYLVSFLASDEIQEKLNKLASDGKTKVITKEKILNLDIPRLSEKEEKEQAKQFNEDQMKIAKKYNELNKLLYKGK